MSEMIDLTPRDYEVSVWTLQDSYKATLKWSGIDHQGQIMTPKMSISDDGTETFSFSIPMYLNVKKGNQVVKTENPMWYTVKDNELLLQNMRKIKVILDKGKANREKVYEFIIVKVKDSHEDDKLQCDVECEGLAFHELGKQGFKIELSSEVFYDRLKKYTEGKKWYDNNYIEHSEEPVETIAYWMNDLDIQSVASASSRFVSKWYYDVRMRYDNSGAISNQIMEDAYISAWNDDLSPKTVEPRAEKKRLIDAKESNKYNLTQTIAEKFGVFCRYEYTHDANYCITGRTVVFYNDFLRDENGFSELTYPHSSLKIEREHDATDITTKMFVRPEEDTSSLTGQISIIDTEANMTKEDYIMNFDYFHNIKTISDDQYEALTSYNQQIHDINCGTGQQEGLISLQEQLIAKEERKIEVKAQLKVAENSVDEAEKRISDASAHKTGLADQVVDYRQPKKYMVLTDENGINYINLGTANREIKFNSIQMYRKWNSAATSLSDAFPELDIQTFPSAKTLEFNASTTTTKNTIRLYKTIYKAKNNSEISYEAAREKIRGYFNDLNNNSGIKIPNVYNGAGADFDEAALTSTVSYNILDDQIGWVLAAAGYATIDTLYEGSPNYVIKKIKLWGSGAGAAEIAFTNNTQNITKQSWNDLIIYRKNWMLAVTNNTKRSEIDIVNAIITYSSSSSGTWFNTPAGITITVQPSLRPSGKYRVIWTYQNSTLSSAFTLTGVSLKSLWTNNKTEDNAASDWTDLGVTGYQDMLRKIGINVSPNRIKSFSAKRDSNHSLIALINLPDVVKDSAVYLTYTWKPDLYWEQIEELWTKKKTKALAIKEYYNTEYNTLTTAIDALETRINELLQKKHQIIEQFNSLMGPALRESYWQPEDYHNYGDLHKPDDFTFSYNYTEPQIEKDAAALIWDTKPFSEEQKITYGYGVNNKVCFYECLDLNTLITNYPSLLQHMHELVFSFYDDYIDRGDGADAIYYDRVNNQWFYEQSYDCGQEDGTFVQKIIIERKAANRKYYSINADMFFGYAKQSTATTVVPVLILTGLNELPDETINFIMQGTNLVPDSQDNDRIRPGAQAQLGYFDDSNVYQSICTLQDTDWLVSRNTEVNADSVGNYSGYAAVYPRFEIKTLQLKNVYTTLIAIADEIDNVLLEEYNDFTIFNRDTSNFITIKPEVFITDHPVTVDDRTIHHNLFQEHRLGSAKQDPVPLKFKLSYMISNGGTYIYLDALKVLKENSIPKVAYTVQPNLNNQMYRKYDLGQIVMINDYELKLHNVFGYISQITMDLDHYWQDEITVKDYKNKFEDLFSTITAQVEEMKKNSGIISSITAGILPEGLASSIMDLEDSNAQSRFYSIIDAYIDANFDGEEIVRQNVNEILKEASVIISDGAVALNELGDLNRENAGILSTLLSEAADKRNVRVYRVDTYDPNDGSVTGYNIGDICITPDDSRYTAIANYGDSGTPHFMPVYDGSVSKITGATMEIDAEKGYIDLKAQNEINIASGKSLHIAAGSDISMVGNKVVNIAGPTINICSNQEHTGGYWEGNNYIAENTTDYTGSINIVSQYFDLDNPINNTSSGVYIKPTSIEMISSKITMITPLGTSTVNEQIVRTAGSAVRISDTGGIWMGTNCDAGIRLYTGTENAIYTENKIGGVANPFTGGGSSLELLPDKIFFGTLTSQGYGSTIYMDPDKFIIATGNADSYINKDFSDSTGLVGAKFTKNSIGFATYTNNIFNAVLMDNNGISMASGAGANITNITDQAVTETNGSFLRLSPNGIRMGTTADLYINADNFKLQTNAAPIETGTLGQTVFAIGTHLNGITSNTTVSDLKGNSTVRFLINQHCAYINGAIHATADSEIAGFYVGTQHFSSILSSGSRRDSIDSEIKGVYIGTNGISITDNRDPNYFYRIVTFWQQAWVELYDQNKDTIYAELKQSQSFTSSLANTVNAWNTWWRSVHAPTEEIPASNSEQYLELAWTLQDQWRTVQNDQNWKTTFWDVTEYSVLVNIIKAVLLYSRSTTETTSDYGRVLFKIDVNRSLLQFGGDINGNNSLLKVDATKDVIDINGITNVLTAINIGKDFSNDGDNDISTTDFNIYSGYFRLINKLDSSSDRWYIRLGLRVDKEGIIKDPTPLGYANKRDLGDNHYTYDVVYLCTYSIKLIARGWIHGDGASKTLATFSHSGSQIKATLENTTTAPSGINFGEISMDTIIWSGTTQVE